MKKFIVRAMQPSEVHAVGQGIAQTFSKSAARTQWIYQTWCNTYMHHPHLTPGTHRVGLWDGKIVSHALVEAYTLRYGSARLRVAGIGKVYTLPDYQHQGYAAAILRDALTYAIELGAHLALLDGIRGYYTQFGFSPVFPVYEATFNAAEVAALPAPLTLRPARPPDAPILAALFERHWGGRVTFTRPPEIWQWRTQPQNDYRQTWVVVGADDQPQGYIFGQDLITRETEVIAHTTDAALTLLSTAGKAAQHAGQTHVYWALPPDDALIAFAQQRVNLTIAAHYQPDGGWMARLIDAPALIDALLPELIAQAKTQIPTINERTLSLAYTPEGVAIGLRDQPETNAKLSQRDFSQLLFGSLSPAMLGLRAGLPAASVALLQALFPPRIATLGAWDWF